MRLTDIQRRILETKRMRLAHLHTRRPEELREEALVARKRGLPHQLRSAITRPNSINIIAEIKRASSNQKVIQAEIDPAELALAYSRGGAVAISVWTEKDYFHGSLNDLRIVRAAVSLPVLRKDLIIEPSQVYETAIVGADAVLLIAAVLDDDRLGLLRQIAEEEVGLDALVEVQNRNELLRAYAMGASLIGVNNRSLSTLELSLDVSVEIARAAPEDVLLVSENGLHTKRHLHGLHALGYKGFLIGESLIGSDHPDEILRDLL
jgi:indole-3-glycerol phosphate synthase